MGLIKGSYAFTADEVLEDRCDEGTVGILRREMMGICDHDRTSKGTRTSRYVQRALRMSKREWLSAKERGPGTIPTIPGRGRLIKGGSHGERALAAWANKTHDRQLSDSCYDPYDPYYDE